MIRLFNVSIPLSLIILLIGDTVTTTACYAVAGLLALNSALDPWFYFRFDNGWLQLTFVVLVFQLALYFLDLYDLRSYSRSYLLQQLCLALGMSFIAQALVGYSEANSLQMPQWTMLYGSVFTLLVIPIWRTTFNGLVGKSLPIQRILFLGLSSTAVRLVDELHRCPEFGMTVLGYIDSKPSSDVPQATYLGTLGELEQIVRTHKPDRLVVSRMENEPLPAQLLMEFRMSGIQIEMIGSLYEEVLGRVAVHSLQPDDFCFSRELRPRPWTIRFQSLYSFVGGVVGLIVALPIMLLVAIAVRLTSPGPAIYSQERVGRNGARFRIYKFRSMYVDAEKRTGPVWATREDPRITPLGRWLRKLRLDELPQLINVLMGSMALVGPRPERPEFCKLLEQQIPFFHQRHLVKPGITGWAQINHRYADTIEDTLTKLEYDLYYVKNIGPSLDAYVIFHTLKVMLLSRGAQ